MYFITICTKNREPILSKIHETSMQMNVGVALMGDPCINHEYKKTIQININTINENNKNVNIEPYVIMPDHIHFILEINVQDNNANGVPEPVINVQDVNYQGSPRSATPTVPKLINSFKSIVSKKIGYSIMATRILRTHHSR